MTSTHSIRNITYIMIRGRSQEPGREKEQGSSGEDVEPCEEGLDGRYTRAAREVWRHVGAFGAGRRPARGRGPASS
jgi:hypothetical protein